MKVPPKNWGPYGYVVTVSWSTHVGRGDGVKRDEVIELRGKGMRVSVTPV